MHRALPRFLSCAVFAGALFAAACGGNDGGVTGGGSGSGDNRDPLNVAESYLLTGIRVFTGEVKSEDMLRLFEPSCRDKVAPADVQKGLERQSDQYPKLKGVKIEDFDFQNKAKVEKRSDGAKVTIPGVEEVRVKVDGKWHNAFDYFKTVALADDDDRGDSSDVDLILRDGRYYLADCDDLEDVAAAGRRANATPTPARATPTTVRGTTTVTSGTPTPTRTGTPASSTPRPTNTPATIGR